MIDLGRLADHRHAQPPRVVRERRRDCRGEVLADASGRGASTVATRSPASAYDAISSRTRPRRPGEHRSAIRSEIAASVSPPPSASSSRIAASGVYGRSWVPPSPRASAW